MFIKTLIWFARVMGVIFSGVVLYGGLFNNIHDAPIWVTLILAALIFVVISLVFPWLMQRFLIAPHRRLPRTWGVKIFWIGAASIIGYFFGFHSSLWWVGVLVGMVVLSLGWWITFGKARKWRKKKK